MNRNDFEITGTGLKIIAMITMLIDHIGAGLIELWLEANRGIIPAVKFNSILRVDYVLRGIGRFAFPIYCFLLIEGFLHTHDVRKYVIRLLSMAVFSEVIFDYLFYRKLVYWNHNNVLWELTLGIICLYLYKKTDETELNLNLKYLIRIVIMFAGMTIAHYCHLDYKEAGICCISTMYYLNGPTRRNRLVACGMGIMILTLISSALEATAFLILIPMSFYKGKRGKDSKPLRRFFYLFYPAHMIVLGLIATVLKIC